MPEQAQFLHRGSSAYQIGIQNYYQVSISSPVENDMPNVDRIARVLKNLASQKES